MSLSKEGRGRVKNRQQGNEKTLTQEEEKEVENQRG